ncbi:hypothetical protein SRABI128_04370 [Microbacterium sp. Bi128]|nr:hypothetical protein SRABI128_04370 [Microbacterium sp. Bi128]
MASTAPLPTHPRSGVAMAAKSSALPVFPVGCSASGPGPVNSLPKSSAPSASIRERRCAQTSRRGVCSPFMTERRIRRVRAALRRPRTTAAGRPSAAKVASSWENPCPGSLTAMLRTSLKRLPRRAPAACSGTFQPAACLSRRCTCALRAAVALPRAWGRCETWNIRALGTTTTRCPARRLRQQKSTSSPLPGRAGSKPRSSSQMSRRTSMPAELTAKVSLRPSYWPWSSSSASISVSRSAQRLVESPTSISRRSACQSSCLQPATVTDGARSTARRSSARASGAGAASSCSSQIQSVPGAVAAEPSAGHGARALSPAMTAPPMPDLGWSKTVTLALPSSCSRRAAEWSRDPVSTPITASAGRVWAASAARVLGRKSPPSWETTTAVTRTS